MGDYTELVLACELSKETPETFITLIKWCIDGDQSLRQHISIEEQGFRGVLYSDSAYFPYKAHSTLNYVSRSNAYQLSVRANMKNYDNFIYFFIVAISVHAITDGFVGYERSEYSDDPNLIYFQEGKVYLAMPPSYTKQELYKDTDGYKIKK